MLITIHVVLLGNGHSLCHQVGRFDETCEVEFIMWITIREALLGKGQTQKDCNISSNGKEKDSMLFNKEIKDFFTHKLVLL